jgi:hypothetical protein
MSHAHAVESVEIDPSHPVVAGAIKALTGAHPFPDEALSAFHDLHGPDVLEGLRQHLFGGSDGGEDEKQTEGFLDDPSDGMADELESSGPRGPNSICLSGGEYVMPADVTSDLGSGNSMAGAKVLDSLVAYVRQMRHGTTEQPPQVNGRELVMGLLKQLQDEE